MQHAPRTHTSFEHNAVALRHQRYAPNSLCSPPSPRSPLAAQSRPTITASLANSVRTLMRRGEYAPQGERVARSQKAIGSSLGMRVPPQSDLLSPESEYHRTRWVTRQDVADRGAGRWRAQNLIKYIANVSTQDIGKHYICVAIANFPQRPSGLRTPSLQRAVDQDDGASEWGGSLEFRSPRGA